MAKKDEGPQVPKGYQAGETSYKFTQERFYYPKPKPMPKAKRPKKSPPMEVKVVNKVKIQDKK
jgi:hypothetical protein